MADETDGESGSIDRRRAIATLFLVVFIDLLGFGILIPVIPLYAKFFGANEFIGSLLIATYSLFQFVGAPVLGRLSDDHGRRPILLLSLLGSVVAWTLFGVAGELGPLLGAANGLVVLFVARAFAGAMGGNIATANAYIADITPPEDRARGIGILGAAFGLGFVFGPAISGVMSSSFALSFFEGVLPAFVPVSQFTMPSFAAAVLSLLNLGLAFVVLPEPSRRKTTTEATAGSRLRGLYEAVTSPAIGPLVVAFFLASFAFSAFESEFIFLTNDRLGLGTAGNAVLLTYIGVVIAVVQGGLIGPLTDRFGEHRLALAGAAIQLVTLALVPFSISWSFVPSLGPIGSGTVGLALVATPLALGNAFTNVSLNALVSLNADADAQGGAFGLTQSAGSLARTFGPAAAGLLYVAVAYWSPFVVAGLLFVPILALLWRMGRGSASAVPG
ncbi:MFS transporter [Halococcus sediminicola]|uniref:MFS transporter n=1 Tax=Halococcus sediminicola TaxID=1264579 RepID=UPI0006784C28|nr:MFS transporter [Halococcus sediminicola]